MTIMSGTSGTSIGPVSGRHAARSSEEKVSRTARASGRDVFAREHPVVFALLGLLIALLLTVGALQALMLLVPGATTGA